MVSLSNLYTKMKNCTEDVYVTKGERVALLGGSKGNQIKWLSDNRIVKKDCLGYESVAEVAVYNLLTYTDLQPQEYLKYYMCNIYEDGRYIGQGCYSYNFAESCREVSIASILDSRLLSYNISYDDLRDLLFDIVGFDVKRYIDKILCLDAITRNDDRHFGNISLLYDGQKYTVAPIFDNGSSCLSDIISYPFSESVEDNLKTVQAKPFSIRFEEQLHNVVPINLRYSTFMQSVVCISKEEKRAYEVIRKGLASTEGIAWIRC